MNRIQMQEKLIKPTKYSKWYLDIIEKVKSQNRTKLKKFHKNYQYYEEHHILPKAKGLFEEYADLKENPWNGVLLTAKEHFICHRLIQKHYAKLEYTYGDIKMSWAIDNMSSYGKFNAKHYENFKLNLSHTEESKRKMSVNHKGFTGKFHTIETKNRYSIIRKGNPQKGGVTLHSQKSKIKMSDTRRGQDRGKYKTSICPKCKLEGGASNMRRWHGEFGEKCKSPQ